MTVTVGRKTKVKEMIKLKATSVVEKRNHVSDRTLLEGSWNALE